MAPSTKSKLRSAIENHAGLAVASVALAAFAAGYGAYEAILSVNKRTTCPTDACVLTPEVQALCQNKLCPPATSPQPASQSVLSRQTEACIKKAADAGKPYVVLSATMRVRLEDSGKTRTSEIRDTYTILPLKQILTSQTLFKEGYQSSNARSAKRLPGSENEIAHGSSSGGTSYEVTFDAEAGRPKTISTGTAFEYALPLPPGRAAFASTLTMASNQDHVAYPNDADVVCELTVIVESSTVKLEPEGQAAKRVLTDRTVRQANARFANENGMRSISAQWLDVEPNEELGIFFRF